jgi:hypothetical protein
MTEFIGEREAQRSDKYPCFRCMALRIQFSSTGSTKILASFMIIFLQVSLFGFSHADQWMIKHGIRARFVILIKEFFVISASYDSAMCYMVSGFGFLLFSGVDGVRREG